MSTMDHLTKYQTMLASVANDEDMACWLRQEIWMLERRVDEESRGVFA